MRNINSFPKEAKTQEVKDTILAGLFVLPFAAIHFGAQIIFPFLLSVSFCVLFDFGGQFLFSAKPKKFDLTSVLTGMIIAFSLPATSPKYFYIIAAAFATLVTKHPFGGYGNNIFNPAAGGLAFVTISFSEEFFDYSALQREIDSGVRVLGALREWHLPELDKFHVLIGNQLGSMGSTQILAIVVCLAYLCYKKAISGRIVWPFLLTCSAIALAFPRAGGCRLESLFYELFSGMLLFSAVFMFTDPVTAPELPISRVLYGVLSGVLVMLFRYFGRFEEGVVFVVLIVNSLAKGIDAIAKKYRRRKKRLKQVRH
ncbi:MAG: RnfABCDGE type electron transport complex subunit D [Oscillospiraceae bacterium]|jgi:electron transport complex protein RnfD|nr:RnfABCDGE type electron transport complex subunit D [Oscillospiraceae bacterium]